MNRMRVRLWLLVMLVLFVGPGLVHARPATEERTAVRAAEPSALSQAWDRIVSIFEKVGSFIDPLGQSPPSGGTSSTNVGSFIDPLGGGQ